MKKNPFKAMERKDWLKIISMVVICWTILWSVIALSKTGLYIKDVSNNQLPQNLVTNTIAVDGEGKIYAEPDTLILTVQVSEMKTTTKEAQDAVNAKITQIQDILKANSVDSKNIQTTSVSVYPEYDYTEAGSKLKGYRASHALTIKVKQANIQNKEVGSKIIDAVSGIGEVQVNNVSYDIDDKTDVYSQARKLAMEKAGKKAQEMADIAGVKLLKPISISESTNYYYPTPMYANSYKGEMAATDSAAGWSISLGQLEFTINVNVVYSIE